MIRIAAATLLLSATPLFAGDVTLGDLTLSGAHILETPPNAPVAGGYVEITNGGSADDRLLAVSVAPEVAGKVELHTMEMQDGVMKMFEVEGGIELPSGATVVLERGGLHVMFMQLQDQLSSGDTVDAVLQFETAGEVAVSFAVKARGDAGHGDHGKQGEGDHSSHGNHSHGN